MVLSRANGLTVQGSLGDVSEHIFWNTFSKMIINDLTPVGSKCIFWKIPVLLKIFSEIFFPKWFMFGQVVDSERLYSEWLQLGKNVFSERFLFRWKNFLKYYFQNDSCKTRIFQKIHFEPTGVTQNMIFQNHLFGQTWIILEIIFQKIFSSKPESFRNTFWRWKYFQKNYFQNNSCLAK